MGVAGIVVRFFAILLFTVTTFQGTLVSRCMQSWLFRHLGLLSYSLYLFHISVMTIIEPYQLKNERLFIVTFLISYVVAIVSYVSIEKPFLSLKPKAKRATVVPLKPELAF